MKAPDSDVGVVIDTNKSEMCVQGHRIYVQPGVYAMSSRKLEALINIARVQKYYQCNPVRFIEDFFGVVLLDAQAWVVQRSWNCGHVLLLCTRGFGKSTVIDLYLMAKDMLFCNYWSYICSGSGAQAQQTFITLERLANNSIDTMVGSTGELFKAEVEIKNAAGDGFSHSSDGFKYNLYNGSMTMTLNSNIDRKRGLRGNVVFDESSFLSEEMLKTYAAFAIVNKSFKTGKDRSGEILDAIKIRTIPPEIPNQLFYISSASSTDTEYYKLYRDFSKRMLIGDPDYFVAQIDCEVCFSPTVHGKPVAPLLERSTVESEMRTNPEKARREYYCEFTSEAGADAIIRRGVIARNSEIRKPILYNDTGSRKIVICYDPARSRDNSVILVGELYDASKNKDGSDYKGRLLNCISLADIGVKNRTPMQTPQQIEYLKKIILDYNLGGSEMYSNISGIYIDAGSGGGGVNIADFFMADWEDEAGEMHRGLIDKEYSEEYVKRYPNAVNKLHLVSPTKMKSTIYEAAIEMTHQDKVSFTADYDNKGYLLIVEEDDKKLKRERAKLKKKYAKDGNLTDDEIEKKVQDELSNIETVNTRMEKLSWDEEKALINIDCLKEELVNITRIKRQTGNDSFELVPEKRNKLHDDRAYVYALFCYALQEERRKHMLRRKKNDDTDLASLLAAQVKKSSRQIGF